MYKTKPTLWVLVGLSGSGKSTIATQIANENPNTIIVSSDAIREELTGNYENQEHNEEVFKIFHNRIRKNLENKKNVIADATNLTMKSRRAIMMKVNGLNIRKVCIIIPKPFEQCKEDNLHREHPVPEEVLDSQIKRFEIPFKEEDWEDIFIIKFKNKNAISIDEMFNLMDGFEQRTPYHNKTLLDHCRYTAIRYIEKCDSIPYVINSEFMSGAFIHDIGKLYTQTFDENGIAHYYGHPNYGSYFVLENLVSEFDTKNKLIYTCDYILDKCFLINYHMMPFNWTTDKARQRWKERFGEYKYQMLLDFNECDRARSDYEM